MLSDPQKRQYYDQFGNTDMNQFPGGGPGGATGTGPSPEDILRNFADFFGGGVAGDMRGMGGMGGGMTRPKADAAHPGADKQTMATLTFAEAVHGVKKGVTIGARVECKACEGSGKTEKTKVVKCRTCDGNGMVARQGSSFFEQVVSECHVCHGAGETLANACKTCRGQGIVGDVKDVSVNFPAGVDTGMVLRVPGGGDMGVRRGNRGDLYVQVRILENDYFCRDGVDLHVVAPITMSQAALGSEVQVRTVDSILNSKDSEGRPGTETLKIEPGTQPDDIKVMRGKGVRKVNGVGRGDQYVHLKVVVPKEVEGRKKELLQELNELETSSQSSKKEKGSKSEGPFDTSLLQKLRRGLKGMIGRQRR